MNDSAELLNSARFLFRSFVHLLLAAVVTLPVPVQLLLDCVPLSRVVLLVDTTTRLDDLAHVLEMADRRRAADSPNNAASRVVDLVRISSGGPRAARGLLERLCAAATQ